MFGEQILARSLSVAAVNDSFGNVWQYHSRSDRHSKISCWGVLFDVLIACPLIRQHAVEGKIRFGINHPMTDFVTGREKVLDLVVCIPRAEAGLPETFGSLADRYAISLTAQEQSRLASLPDLLEGPVGDVLIALESKACMTAHHKAAPRLFDELTSAAQCINGSAPGAIAVGHSVVNTSPQFISSDRNKKRFRGTVRVVSRDNQPASWEKTLATIRRLVVRGHATERGYDALAVTMLSMVNDGSPVVVATTPPALPANDSLNYQRMIARISGLYDTRFQNR